MNPRLRLKSHIGVGDCMFAYSTVIRRHQFLINTLRGYNCCLNQLRKMTAEGSKREGFCIQEPDAESLLRRITPVMESSNHKGQAGTRLRNFFLSRFGDF